MNIALIHNPVAGRRSRELVDYALPRLRAENHDVQTLATEYPGHATELARTTGNTADMVVVAGGDGTINEAINGLVYQEAALGILPVGTANVLGYEIGIGTRVDQAIDTILHGERRAITVGWTGQRYFLLMAGVGFDAEIVQGVNLKFKSALGKIAYGISGVKVFIAGMPPLLRVSADNQRFLAQSVIIHNVCHYGGNFNVAPDAGLEKPNFAISVFPPASRAKLAYSAMRFLRGRHVSVNGVHYFKSSRIRVTSDDETQQNVVQLDGDVSGKTPFEATLVEGALSLVMPRRT